MFPTISLGSFSISTFGVFLALAFLFGVFLTWRLSRAWDIPEERVLDLTLLTFLGGLIGARIYFILDNFSLFGPNVLKWILFQKYGGFSVWGAILGGYLTLYFFSKRFKINLWQALDFASVGFLGGLIFESLACFLGGCNIGIQSNLFFAQPMVGVVGTRVPIQLLEALLLFFALMRLWRRATHFHIQGTVAASSLIYIGAVMLTGDFFRESSIKDLFFSVILIILGLTIFYKVTKRKIGSDIKAFSIFLISLLKDPKSWIKLMLRLQKSWYNYKVNVFWKLRQLSKFLRRLNVYFSHKNSKYY